MRSNAQEKCDEPTRDQQFFRPAKKRTGGGHRPLARRIKAQDHNTGGSNSEKPTSRKNRYRLRTNKCVQTGQNRLGAGDSPRSRRTNPENHHPPPPPASRAKVIALRKKLKMSQSVFAAALNVSIKLVQSWEQGTRKPDRGELRLIEILIKQPEIVSNLILANEPIRQPSKASRNGKASSKRRATAA